METVMKYLRWSILGIKTALEWYWHVINDKTEPIWLRAMLGVTFILDVALLPLKIVLILIGLIVKRPWMEELAKDLYGSMLIDLEKEEGS